MIILKSLKEIEKIRTACLIVTDALDGIRELIKPGLNTLALDEFAEKFIIKAGGKPAFKGYRGYPKSLCTSINEQVVHGIPSRGVLLRSGDIISLDLGAIIDGYYGDAAITLPVGNISEEAKRLLRVTEEALYKGIEAARAGNRLHDVSHAVQSHAEAHGYSVVRDFVGHGIGRSLHEDPQVPNYGERGTGPRLKPGMVFAVEPMVNVGGRETVINDDGWTAVTADGSLSSHFEHTIAVMTDGPWILSKR